MVDAGLTEEVERDHIIKIRWVHSTGPFALCGVVFCP